MENNRVVMSSRRPGVPMGSDVDVSHLCRRCKKTLKKPMQSPCSGFRFCKDCADFLQNGYEVNTCCPFCNDPDSSEIHKVYSDKGAERDLLARTNVCEHEKCLKAEKMPVYEGVITVLNREVAKLTLQLEARERQRRQEREQLDAMDRKVKTLERTTALKGVTISELDLRITALEQTSYDGTLLWKITDFTRKRQEAISGRMTSIYSTAFYTSKTGYKMCARLYLNGDGIGKGSHISLFFVIMRGQYDALLRWPFRQKVALMFLDQSGKDQHVMDAFRPDPTSSSFKRPSTETNIASECPLLMPLRQLDSPRHEFVKDDTGFIKILVSLDNLS